MSKVHFPTLYSQPLRKTFTFLSAAANLCISTLHLLLWNPRYMYVMWENINNNPSAQHDNPQKYIFFYSTMTPQLRVGVNEFCMVILFKFNWFRHATHTHTIWLMASEKLQFNEISHRRCCSLFLVINLSRIHSREGENILNRRWKLLESGKKFYTPRAENWTIICHEM